MKKEIILSTALCLAGGLSAQITDLSVNFNGDATSYTDNFVRFGDSEVGGTGLNWSADGGANGSGGLVVTEVGARNIFYRPVPLDDATSVFNLDALPAGTSFTSTTDFFWNNTTSTDLTVITNGFVTANASQSALTSAGALAGSIIRNGSNTVTLRMRSGNGNAPGALDFDQSFLDAESWYQLRYTLEKTATENQFAYSVGLYSLGSNGTDSATLFNADGVDIFISGFTNSSQLYGDENAFFGYDIRGGSTGISNVDNFAVAVPEPGTFALLAGLSSLGYLMVRRRSRA